MRNLTIALVSVAAVALLAGSANADLLVYEPFEIGSDPSAGEYTVGDLSGQGPASLGFTQGVNWAHNSGADASVSATGLTHSLVPSTSGGSANSGVEGINSRALSSSYGSDGTTVWLSYLMKADAFGNDQWRNLSLANGPTFNTDYRLEIAWDGFNAFDGIDQMIIYNRPTLIGVGTAVTPTGGATNLMLLKLTFGAGATDSATLWINPSDVSSEAGLGAGTTLANKDFAFNTIFFDDHQGAGGAIYDEIRLGDTLNDVVIPEPGTLVLLGTGLLALLLCARRRQAVARPPSSGPPSVKRARREQVNPSPPGHRRTVTRNQISYQSGLA